MVLLQFTLGALLHGANSPHFLPGEIESLSIETAAFRAFPCVQFCSESIPYLADLPGFRAFPCVKFYSELLS